MSESIVIEAGTDPTQVARMRAYFANPGEVVQPRALTVRPELKAAADAKGLTTLTVARLTIGADPRHEFVEIPGSWAADMVKDPRELIHHYGAMVREDDAYWLVPTTDQGEPNGEPIRVSGEPSRWALHSVGTMEQAIGDGAMGEFVVAEIGDGHQLVGVPWHSEISAEESDKARAAVAAHVSAPSPR